MNAVRGVITAFLLAVLVLCGFGWRSTGSMPSPKLEGARVALGLSAFAALGGLALVWSAKPRKES